MNDTHVRLRVRADAYGGKRVVTLAGPEFVRRLLLHVLPTGIKRIRHDGVLAPSGKRLQLAQARAALQMPATNPVAIESAHDFVQRVARHDLLQCPRCLAGRLRVSEAFARGRHLPTPAAILSAAASIPLLACRAPPASTPAS